MRLKRIATLSLAFASIVLTVRAVQLSEQGFVRDWLIGGPYPNYQGESCQGEGIDTDFLDGECDCEPCDGMSGTVDFVADPNRLVACTGAVNEWGWKTTKRVATRWTKTRSKRNIVSLNGRFGGVDDWFVAYAVCYLNVGQDVDAVLTVGSDDDHKLYLNRAEVGRRASSQGVAPGEFRYKVRLKAGVNRVLLKVCDRMNDCGFAFQVLDSDGQSLAGVDVMTDAKGLRTVLADEKKRHYAADVLVPKLRDLNTEIAALEAELKPVRAENDSLKKSIAVARKDLANAYEVRERMFACERAKAIAKAESSVDEALPPLRACRRRLCVNGDWRASLDEGRTWMPFRLPAPLMQKYFLSRHYPVLRKKDGKNNVPITGYENVSVSPVTTADHLLFETDFSWDGNGGVEFVCEAIIGEASFSVNGVSCGSYDGIVGVVRIDLAKGLRQGKNVFRMELQLRHGPREANGWGVRGDMYFDFVPCVRVSDVYVKTGWTTARLSAETEVYNATERPKDVEIRQYAVRNGRIRFRLPLKKLTIEAGTAGCAISSGLWADPMPWGIGGKYGNPDLYDMVTDLVCGGETVDRHRMPFGYREFRIFGTDFFLNGRRIILQGDVSHAQVNVKRLRDILWPLLREDGVNIVRTHDSDYWSLPALTDADRMGMLVYAQMYPMVGTRGVVPLKSAKACTVPFEKWSETPEHAWNLANYRRWFKACRNHPSVVIWSTDNEIFTQSWDDESRAALNVRNDRVAALYEKYVKSLDLDLVLTRNGDVGTMNRAGRWFEDPPCDTANYHYPDYNPDSLVRNWRQRFEWRPIVFGETLYCAYGAFDNWIGAIPLQVMKKANKVRRIVSLYREQEIPCAVGMGVGMDGFIRFDDTGKGNPYGLKASEMLAFPKTGRLPTGFKAGTFPWVRIPWPSASGIGERMPYKQISDGHYGVNNINWHNGRFPSHVRNEVNDAYRQSWLEQPAVRTGIDVEVIVEGVSPRADVWCLTPDGQLGGVRADVAGRAWFGFPCAGEYVFGSPAVGRRRICLQPRLETSRKPGFGSIPRLSLSGKEDGR